MDLSNLKPAEGSVKGRKRIGRGQGSGKGGTSTRGNKGASKGQDINKSLVLKVDKCLYTKGFQNLDLKILIGYQYRGVNLTGFTKIS